MNTGLSAIWFGNPPILIYLYYIDKSGVLQELRGGHASTTWSNGTLGTAGFRATSTYSALSAQFQGRCGDRGQLGWVFYESDKGVQEAHWYYDNDTWVYGNLFRNIQPGSSFTTTIAGSAIPAWRFYGINKDLNVQEYACVECCKNSTAVWGTGTNFLTFFAGFASLSLFRVFLPSLSPVIKLHLYQLPCLPKSPGSSLSNSLNA